MAKKEKSLSFFNLSCVLRVVLHVVLHVCCMCVACVLHVVLHVCCMCVACVLHVVLHVVLHGKCLSCHSHPDHHGQQSRSPAANEGLQGSQSAERLGRWVGFRSACPTVQLSQAFRAIGAMAAASLSSLLPLVSSL